MSSFTCPMQGSIRLEPRAMQFCCSHNLCLCAAETKGAYHMALILTAKPFRPVPSFPTLQYKLSLGVLRDTPPPLRNHT
eukprot:6487166-Amphidinium_carterae.1